MLKQFGIVKMRNASCFAKQHLTRINQDIQNDKSKTGSQKENLTLAIAMLEAAPDLIAALDHLLQHVKSPECPLTHIKRAVDAIDHVERSISTGAK